MSYKQDRLEEVVFEEILTSVTERSLSNHRSISALICFLKLVNIKSTQKNAQCHDSRLQATQKNNFAI